MQQPQPLGSEFGVEPAYPSDVAPRPIDAGDKAGSTGLSLLVKTIGIVLVIVLATSAELLPPVAAITAT